MCRDLTIICPFCNLPTMERVYVVDGRIYSTVPFQSDKFIKGMWICTNCNTLIYNRSSFSSDNTTYINEDILYGQI